jgi:hypothetical protein
VDPNARKSWVVRLHYCSAVLAAAAIVAVLGGIGVTTTIGGLFDAVLIGLSLGVVAGTVFLFCLWMDRQSGGGGDGQTIEEDDSAAAP